jgi:signal transduction histidine kinase
VRNRILVIARANPDGKNLNAQFETVLQEMFGASFASLITEGSNNPRALIPRKESLAYTVLRTIGWATPESLHRRRRLKGSDELRHCLIETSVGLMIAVPPNSPSPSLILALGNKLNGGPYMHPDIEQIEQIARFIDNILTQSRLTTQAAQNTRIEHLAMMSRGLAHDLKNLITPISSFLVHSESKIAPDTVEAEVHTAAKRSVRIMNDYIREALFFANRLEPRFETVSTGKLFDFVRELTSARAGWRQVKLVIAMESDHTLIADAVLLQRLLGNLVHNAIDASPPGKIVTLAATENNARGLRLSVVDQGSGIAPEHLTRVFEPYFTTKEFGDDVRGFGLGLTISQKIVHLHHGTISVQSQLGVGTAVIVDLPLKQPEPATITRMTELSVADDAPIALSSAPPP